MISEPDTVEARRIKGLRDSAWNEQALIAEVLSGSFLAVERRERVRVRAVGAGRDLNLGRAQNDGVVSIAVLERCVSLRAVTGRDVLERVAAVVVVDDRLEVLKIIGCQEGEHRGARATRLRQSGTRVERQRVRRGRRVGAEGHRRRREAAGDAERSLADDLGSVNVGVDRADRRRETLLARGAVGSQRDRCVALGIGPRERELDVGGIHDDHVIGLAVDQAVGRGGAVGRGHFVAQRASRAHLMVDDRLAVDEPVRRAEAELATGDDPRTRGVERLGVARGGVLVDGVGVGGVDSGADVVIRKRGAGRGAAPGEVDVARDGDHRGRLRAADGDVAARLDVGARRDVGVDVVGNRVDRDRAAEPARFAARDAGRDAHQRRGRLRGDRHRVNRIEPDVLSVRRRSCSGSGCSRLPRPARCSSRKLRRRRRCRRRSRCRSQKRRRGRRAGGRRRGL